MQTAREAINSLLCHEKADFVPMHDEPWGDTVRRWVEQGMPKESGGQPLKPCDHFGFDMMGSWAPIEWEARPENQVIVEENEEWKLVRNGNGATLRWWKNKSGTPEHVDFHMTSRRIWEEEYRSHLVGNYRKRIARSMEEIRQDLELAKNSGRWVYLGTCFVWEVMRASLGDINMFMAMADDPDWLLDFNRVYTDLMKSCYDIIFREAGKPDGIWLFEDLGYRDRLFCSPGMLRDLFFPFYKDMIDFCHGHGLKVVLHSCGYQEPMIPLAIDAGFDAINPMEVKAGNDILAYAEQYGDRLAFVGGMDARVLETGDRSEIRKSVRGIISGMRERGARYIYGSDHSLSPNIDYEDFLYSLEVYRECRAL